MRENKRKKGALTVEACISYPVFLMIIVTILYLMRIVYTYGLIQHAVGQTAKELSMYTYIYQVTGANEMYQNIQNSTEKRTEQFNKDAGQVVELYGKFQNKDYLHMSYTGTTNPVDIIKNIGSVMLGQASKELNNTLFNVIVRPMMSGYIGADSKGNSADERLKALRVVGGLNGIDLTSSSFFEDGVTIDIVACYTIDPIMPIDILPPLNLMNRATVRGMSGKTAFKKVKLEDKEDKKKEKSVWDMQNTAERGKLIQEQQGVRNLPDNFSTYSAFDPETGKATAEKSIDLREKSLQTETGIRNTLRSKCNLIENYRKTTWNDVTLDPKQITSKELIVYIPSSKGDRKIDRSEYDKAVKSIKEDYPDITIITKELD